MSIIRDLSLFKGSNIVFDHNSILYYTESTGSMSFLFLQTPVCTVQYIDANVLWITCSAELCHVIDSVDATYLIRSSSYETYLKSCQNMKQSLNFNINGQRNLLRVNISGNGGNGEIRVSQKIKLILQPFLSNTGIKWTFKQIKVVQPNIQVEEIEVQEQDAVEAVEEISELEDIDTETSCCLVNELNLVPLPK